MAYKTAHVSVLDLARILDWCDISTVESEDKSYRVDIRETEWFGEAYRNLTRDLQSAM